MTISPLSTSSALSLSVQNAGASKPAVLPKGAGKAPDQQRETGRAPETTPQPASSRPASSAELTAEERRVVAQLARIDREVRAHEQAHLSAAGGLARGASFSYVTGPDGRRYAVAGEVSIDASAVDGNPEATIRKAQQIRSAANAPANPSAQDRQVAAQASGMEQAARQELAIERREELEQQARAAKAQAFENQGGPQVGVFLDLLA